MRGKIITERSKQEVVNPLHFEINFRQFYRYSLANSPKNPKNINVSIKNVSDEAVVGIV